MKIGIWGYYGFDNFGDDLILETLLEWIYEIDDKSKTYVFIEKDEKEEILDRFPNTYQRQRTVKTALKMAMQELDVLLIGGGGIFPASTSTRLGFYYLLSMIMKIRRKKVACIGVGVEEKNLLHKSNRLLLNKLISTVDFFSIREGQLREDKAILPIKNEKEVIPTADIVFSRIPNTNVRIENRFNVFLADIFDIFPNIDYELFEDNIVSIINHILEEGYEVCLIPFTNQKDQKLNDRIALRISSDRCFSMPYCKDINAILDEISKGSFSLCMRFHAIVVSMLYEIPMCSISYGDKSSKLMNRINLQQFNSNFGDNNGSEKYFHNIQVDSVLEQIDSMISNRKAIVDMLRPEREKLRQESLRNRELLESVIRG